MEKIITNSSSPLMSEAITELAQALQKAKREFRATGKSGTNAHQKYKYATLLDIYNAVEDALDKNNIIIQHGCLIMPDGKEILRTRIIHTLTGQWMEDQRHLEAEKPGNQAKGAANTYVRKYAVISLCAIAADDDDGEDEEQYLSDLINKVEKLINSHADPKKITDQIFVRFKVQSLKQIKAVDLEKIFNSLKEKQ